jgi:rhamnogalacturonan endolyase
MPKRIFLSLLIMLGGFAANAQYRMEYLNRGLVATPMPDGKVFISWRLLGDEPYSTAFNLYKTTNRHTEKLNKKPIEDVTSFQDEQYDALQANVYIVKKKIIYLKSI